MPRKRAKPINFSPSRASKVYRQSFLFTQSCQSIAVRHVISVIIISRLVRASLISRSSVEQRSVAAYIPAYPPKFTSAPLLTSKLTIYLLRRSTAIYSIDFPSRSRANKWDLLSRSNATISVDLLSTAK